MSMTHEHEQNHEHGHGPLTHIRGFIHDAPMVSNYQWQIPSSVRHLSLIGIIVLVVAMVLTHLGISYALGIGVGVALLLHLPILALTSIGLILRRARTGFIGTVVNLIPWKGNEEVLDVGCGSGILLFACIKESPTAKGTGIDIYDPYSFGGSAGVFWKNAEIEGVKSRINLQQVDARTMPFEDERFNVIVSSLAMHHVGDSADQEKATREIVRTLKPGGKIVICDVGRALNTPEKVFRSLGLANVRRSGHLFQILSAEKR
ncbi:MAG: methyltransferase domain-containing protein [Anaerolineaceae bacterium]|nr:methyltransferase domain-containing protein [Anaerolineaceae bacterium]